MRSIKITKSMIHLQKSLVSMIISGKQKSLVSMIISDNLDFHV